MTKCVDCEQEVHWEEGKGWVHANGYVYEREIIDGELKRTHPARPDWQSEKKLLPLEEVESGKTKYSRD